MSFLGQQAVHTPHGTIRIQAALWYHTLEQAQPTSADAKHPTRYDLLWQLPAFKRHLFLANWNNR